MSEAFGLTSVCQQFVGPCLYRSQSQRRRDLGRIGGYEHGSHLAAVPFWTDGWQSKVFGCLTPNSGDVIPASEFVLRKTGVTGGRPIA